MASRRPRPDEQPYQLVELTPTRQAIGAKTRAATNEKPHFWLSTQVDATALVAVRSARRETEGATAPTYNDYILKATALTLRENPRLNAWAAEDGLHVLERVNVGFATATDQGVMMPTVMDADLKSLAEIAAETRDLIGQARNGKLRASLQMGAGFSISNIGPGEVDAFYAIINAPQVGILAIGALKPRPVVVGDQVQVRQTIILTLSLDHAAADGADGAKFLADLKHKLEDQAFLEDL